MSCGNDNKPEYDCYYGYSILLQRYKECHTAGLTNWDGSGLDFIINPRSIGIGSSLLNHLFLWAKDMYPDFIAPRIWLSPVDELDPENKLRRDRLYSNIGLMGGHEGKKLSELNPTISTKGFVVTPAY